MALGSDPRLVASEQSGDLEAPAEIEELVRCQVTCIFLWV